MFIEGRLLGRLWHMQTSPNYLPSSYRKIFLKTKLRDAQCKKTFNAVLSSQACDEWSDKTQRTGTTDCTSKALILTRKYRGSWPIIAEIHKRAKAGARSVRTWRQRTVRSTRDALVACRWRKLLHQRWTRSKCHSGALQKIARLKQNTKEEWGVPAPLAMGSF